MSAMTQFLEDYEAGKQKRPLSSMPVSLTYHFTDNRFDLGSYAPIFYSFIVNNSLNLSIIESIKELLERCERGSDIFPLLDLAASPSKHLKPTLSNSLNQDGVSGGPIQDGSL